MKKIIVLIGIVLSINGFSQNLKKVHFYIDFGPSLSIPYIKMYETLTEFENHPITKFKSDFGFFSDALVEYKFSDKFALITGVGYLYNSLRINDKIGFEESNGRIKYSNLYVPLLFKCSLSKKIPISFGVGIYTTFKISVKEKGTTIIDTAKLVGIDSYGNPVHGYYLGIEPMHKYNNDLTKYYKKFDVGLTAQIEYEFHLTEKLSFLALTKFNLGLTNTFNHDNAYKWRDYNFQIGVGLKY